MAAVCIFLLLAVALVFGPSVRHEFINYDDGQYVYENPRVAQGLTLRGMAWAFTTRHASNWHPLTWLSHMLDVQLYGLHPGGHHLTNVLLHAATTILLFLLLWRMTGFLWRSVFVAAVFAVHPLRAESVAWVAERKDVLCGLFFMLTLWAYMVYARGPFSLRRYLTVAVFFALGLMSKPMLVTLPFVMLLLDYWPLGRTVSCADPDQSLMGTDFKSVPMNMDSSPRRMPGSRGLTAAGNFWTQGFGGKNQRLILEKIPLLVLAAASCVATYVAQGKAVMPMDALPVSSRIANALVSYMAYIGKLFYPIGLAVFYPHPAGGLPAWQVVAAILALAGISAGAILWCRRFPYWLVGWFWYLGMLVPVIGLVQVGTHAMADRYTYLPQIGLVLAVTWGIAQWTASWRHRVWVGGIASVLVVLILMGFSWRQVSYWHDSETLWRRALVCTRANPIAHNNLGTLLAARGEVDAAIEHYQKALAIEPNFEGAHYNLGNTLAGLGRIDAAIGHFRKALGIRPDDFKVHNNLGTVLARHGRVDAAVAHFQRALEIEPDDAEAHNNLGITLASRGRPEEAVVHFQKALEFDPGNAKIHNNLGIALASRGRLDEAIVHFQRALEIEPDYMDARDNLGMALGQRRQTD